MWRAVTRPHNPVAGWARSQRAKHLLQGSSIAAYSTKPKLPEEAKVVVVGGGIIGTSIAYHLAEQGCKDVVLLERDSLTSGTTWHAAGLMVTFGSLSETSTEFRKYSKQLYSRLEEETGQSTGFMPVGFIELANEKDRLEEYRRVSAFNRKCGVDVHEISPEEVQRLFPLCKVDDVLAGFYVEDDGRVNPVDATMALGKGARARGAKIVEGVTVYDVTQQAGQVTGVETSHGTIKAEYVVNAAGMWARQLGQMSGVLTHNQAAEHYYLLTDEIPEVDPTWPVVEDPASYAYIRPEGGGLMVGLFEGEAAPWNVGHIPSDFSFGEITPDWERIGPYLETAMARVPRSFEVGAKTLFCGPESFTPDLQPVIGEAPNLRNYFVAAGMNSIGILTGGGVGRLVAHWIMNGKPDMDVTAISADRVLKYHTNPEYREARVKESLGMVYKCHYPTFSNKSARNIKHSPIHDRLKDNGAYFKDVSGWEGVDWYAPKGVEPVVEKLCWGRHNWFPYWKEEHESCRNGVVLMDMSFMSKFMVQGKDAGRFLNRLSTANVTKDKDCITYTQWLNDDGKLEADLTVTKLADDKYFVVATDTMHGHVEAWMHRNVGSDEAVVVTDVTGAYAQINIQGPKSRELMQKLTTEDMSDSAYPFRSARDIDLGFARAVCARITYLGELGYELFVPTEHSLYVYDRIKANGEEVGLKHAGLKALSSLRMEKGYRDYGHDMDNTDTLLNVGLGFTCDFEKEGGFIGKEAVLEEKNKGIPTKRLVQVLVGDPEPMMYHGEVLYRNGTIVGDIRAASYGHSLGGAVGLSMVEDPSGCKITNKFLNEGEWEVEIVNKRYPCTVSLRPMYDPSNERIKQ